MKDASVEKANGTGKNVQPSGQTADRNAALHSCYGEIGISAVAAAARYQGTAAPAAAAVPHGRIRGPIG
jgi:hypothetical protein